MDSKHGESLSPKVDRLSTLPDDLIHKILSFNTVKHAIKTSELSPRWRYLWTSMPYLNFSSLNFDTLAKFYEFVIRVLSSRNNQVEVFSVKLTICETVNLSIIKRVLKYAFSHNVQQVSITCLHGKLEFPLSLFSSQSLKQLTLDGYCYKHSFGTPPPNWELPALETLNLYHVTLYDDGSDKCAGLFSKCANLMNLTFRECVLRRLNGFNIRHPGLSSLALEHGCMGVNVDTPQLKNLSISNWRRIHLISAPILSSFHYNDYMVEVENENENENENDYYHVYGYNGDIDKDLGYSDADPLNLSTKLSQLETVNICVGRPFVDQAYIHKIFNLLQQFTSAKFLTLNLELVKLLASSVELQPSPFVNLKTLKIYPLYVTPEEHKQPKVTMPRKVKKYLLDGSPGATVKMVSHQERRDVTTVVVARKLILQLQGLLEEWKENSEKIMAPMEQKKAPVEMPTMHEQAELEGLIAYRNTKMDWHFGERVKDIANYWADLNEQVQKGHDFTGQVISMLRMVEIALSRVRPASYKAMFKAKFESLSAEADAMMVDMMNGMKIQSDKIPKVPHEPAAASSNPSS